MDYFYSVIADYCIVIMLLLFLSTLLLLYNSYCYYCNNSCNHHYCNYRYSSHRLLLLYMYIYIYTHSSRLSSYCAFIVMSLVFDEVDVEIVRLSLLLIMLPPLFLISQTVIYSCFITITTTISPITNSSMMNMINVITTTLTSFLPSKSTIIIIHFEWTSSTSTHCTSISISSSNRSQ